MKAKYLALASSQHVSLKNDGKYDAPLQSHLKESAEDGNDDKRGERHRADTFSRNT